MKLLRFRGGPQGVVHVAKESRSLVVTEGQTIEFDDTMADDLLKTGNWEQVVLSPTPKAAERSGDSNREE